MKHGRKKEREKRRRTDATIVKKRMKWVGAPVEKGAATDRRGMPIKKRCTNAPTNGQVLQRMAREHLGKKRRELDG
jgi:hypothetical protein